MRMFLILIFSLFTSFQTLADLDTSEKNYYNNLEEIKKIFCTKQNLKKYCDGIADKNSEKRCFEREMQVCESKIRIFKVDGLSIHKTVTKKLTVDELVEFNKVNFNSNLVEKCATRADFKNCFVSIAENRIDDRLFDFCEYDTLCISRLSDIHKAGNWLGSKDLEFCRENFNKFGVYACIRKIVENHTQQTDLVKTIGNLELKLYECTQKLSNKKIEHDIDLNKLFAQPPKAKPAPNSSIKATDR